ncbi:hypothetical protein NONO_c14440 [Nocardia nova SH22a]|uniref:DUF2283 domain-containing protein n=1 Tax=Nocardia nova SH22a TaxID=1415166 RepID=W5TAL6_9NOCA|nr:DUF2283 domain-containing protein [Nocardia nova]AHH16247.1 hypothetical protein NONO_c14440 [Nocardia nova SH22a]
MHVTYDPYADAAYLALKHPLGEGEAVRQQVVPLRGADMVLDFDDKDVLLGIEIIGAGAVLPDALLRAALSPGR